VERALSARPEEAREFYLSELLGKKIYDRRSRLLGRVRDLVVRWPAGYPQIVGIKHARSNQIIPLDQVAELGPQGVFLRPEAKKTRTRPVAPEEVFVNRWLLDKQIVDVQGAKVVRVNDIVLRRHKLAGTLLVFLIAVDVGSRGLIRRLGLRRLSESFPERLLDWQRFKPLETRTANLQLVVLRRDLSSLHPADIADIVEDLGRPAQAELLRHLDGRTAAEALTEMDPEVRTHLLENMTGPEASTLVRAMAPDEAADALGGLSADKRAEIFRLLHPEKARALKKLMGYREGTAGSLMTTELVSLPVSLTAQQAIDHLRNTPPAVETISYLYAVNEEEQLQGVLSLRELIVAPPDAPLEEIMRRHVVALRPQDDYETVLEITVKYDLLAVPVVDNGGRLLGIITVDDVLETLFAGRRHKVAMVFLRVLKRR